MATLLRKPPCLIFVLLAVASSMQPCIHVSASVPCYFIFGDSMVDSGNNNRLSTSAKVNYPPYGIDFPAGPTGRFTNGKTLADIITEHLGLKDYIQPFATATESEMMNGVNYASGSSGIRDEAGNNDYINDYFLPCSATSTQYTPDEFAGVLIDHYSKQIRTLHDAGARKIALFGLGAIGCTPNSIVLFGKNGKCAENITGAVRLFNGRLKSLVDQLNKELTDSKVIYINSMGTLGGNPTKLGFKVFNSSCCQVNNVGLCNPSSIACPNRNEFIFWDSFHPTEAMNKITAERAFHAADPSDAYPFGISQLVA
ncbi:FINGER PROTEIN putative-RELATED [Salix viminalis]|uniref:FINGER PROTEIN putative-RELATED n=1 Tax=Salix viminalis TaxID=40686 RepID=A0A9Q0NQ09_SALVM|nr:FINGER PROTEIN putative-RELATED [Salix viminalis]